MTTLWYDLDELEDDDDDEKKQELYDMPAIENEDDPDIDDEDIICKECGAVVEDGYQCPICGLVVI